MRADEVVVFKEHDDLAGNLDDLHGKILQINSGDARRVTLKNRIAQNGAGVVAVIYGVGDLEFRAAAHGVIGDMALPKSRTKDG